MDRLSLSVQGHSYPNELLTPAEFAALKAGGSHRTPRGQRNVTGTLTKAKTERKPEPKGPPPSGAYRPKAKIQRTTFRIFFDRGDIPVSVEVDCRGPHLKWRREADLQRLDVHHYLPLFFDGLRETKEPYATIAEQGVHSMLETCGQRILNVVPQLIIPIKFAMDTRLPCIMCRTMRALQHLAVSADNVGVALVPYYRQILPVFNVFKNKNCNTGDYIEYGQRRQENLGDLIEETLQVLEKNGGEDAYINIKYMIPTYESCTN